MTEGMARRNLLIGVIGLVALGFLIVLTEQAVPGETLYPIREQLRRLGIGHPTMDEVDELVADARDDVEEAQAAARSSPTTRSTMGPT